MSVGGKVVVIGAGIGGLTSAALLAAAGFDVLLLEQAPTPGGKLREVAIGGQQLDAGPTVFTMRWVFDELFDALGTRLEDHLALQPALTLACHAWGPAQQLDLYADLEATVDAIVRFAGPAEAERYRGFCKRAQHIYRTLEQPFLRSHRPNVVQLVLRAGWHGLPAMARISPFGSLWGALGTHFHDPRLRQLFARYATYCGASPFLAPATLMLVAHVEREGVWLVQDGMHRVAAALAAQAVRCGARVRYGAKVAEVVVEGGRAAGVRLADGERIAADAVVFNGDAAALAAGLLGRAASPAVRPGAARSLSAITWNVLASTQGFGLGRHNVFFSADYRAEFDALIRRQALPEDPTVYVCAQDRNDAGGPVPDAERLLCLVNAPATADHRPLTPEEIAACETRAFQRLAACGLQVNPSAPMVRTTPSDFARMFPGTGGALYGPASHGWQASFSRPASRSRLPGLYLAGGSTHPGPGVPMAALSGRLAAARLMADRASTRSWHPVVMPGGTSTR